jgi:hypothetical protein
MRDRSTKEIMAFIDFWPFWPFGRFGRFGLFGVLASSTKNGSRPRTSPALNIYDKEKQKNH